MRKKQKNKKSKMKYEEHKKKRKMKKRKIKIKELKTANCMMILECSYLKNEEDLQKEDELK